MRPPYSRLLTFAFLVFAACRAAQTDAEDQDHGYLDEQHPSELVGSWIRIFPLSAVPETLTLRPDGSASGLTQAMGQGLDSVQISRWQVGEPNMAGALCLGSATRISCQGFRLLPDTLLLANSASTILVRAGAAHVAPATGSVPTGTSLPLGPAAPRPGDTVRWRVVDPTN